MRVGLAIVMDFVTVFIRGIAVLAHIVLMLKIIATGIVPAIALAADVAVVLPAVLANIVQVTVVVVLITVPVQAPVAAVRLVLPAVLVSTVQVHPALTTVLALPPVAGVPPVLIVTLRALVEEEPGMVV